MIKKIVKKDDRSIKTFFLYTLIVLFIIFISLSIKAIFIYRQSKFDGNNINIAISQNNQVVEVLGFNFPKHSVSVLKIRGSRIPTSSIGQELGIIIEGNISAKNDIANQSPESLLTGALIRSNSIKTDLTIFDLARLIIFSKSVVENDRQVEEINEPIIVQTSDKILSNLFKDDEISSENISVEIVNATDEPGLGKRLERCITNIGASVVAVTTPHVPESYSKIQYIGSQGYTVNKFKKILDFPSEKINSGSIAKIVIIIGKDNKSTTKF